MLALAVSLRLRLMLAFAALVSLMLVVGVASFTINDRIRSQVADLQSSFGVDLSTLDLELVGLEIEGYWDPVGSFVATEVELLPGPRRPKLRGRIQDLDPVAGAFTLYGLSIRVDAETEQIAPGNGTIRLTDLRVGQRVEVTCDVTDGVWTADKLQAVGVKGSDKLKGTVSALDLDGVAPESVEMSGLKIALAPAGDSGPGSALHRIKAATQMTLALQECRAVANELLGRISLRHDQDADLERDRDTRVATSIHDRLLRSEQDFGHYLDLARLAGAEDSQPAPSTSTSSDRWLLALRERQPLLGLHVRTLLALAASNPDAARAHLDGVLDPFLEDEILARVYAYLSQSEEELGDQLQSIVSGSEATTRVALVTTGVAILAALVLGVLVWRSVNKPIVALHDAALRIGTGQFDTRVSLPSRDEFGVLAEAFNTMASELASSTVSIGNLQNIFDSMSGALIIFDSDGHVTSSNRAAEELLGYARIELSGRSFQSICAPASDGSTIPIVPQSEDGIVSVAEQVFVRRDGTQVPVSLSGAELRPTEGALQGYVCVAQDLTERKRIENRIRGSLAEKELLLREVHHRVKNNMQVISSLLAMQANISGDPGVAEKFEQSQNRIRSMALIHEQLYQSPDLAEINVRAYLEVLTAQLARSLDPSGTVELEVRVEDLPMDIDQSLACGLIIIVLVGNAFKHAFPNDSSGKILISLTRSRPNEAILTVADDGCGITAPVGTSQPKTLGTSLVRMLVKQIDGNMTIDTEHGSRVRIVFQLPSALMAIAS